MTDDVLKKALMDIQALAQGMKGSGMREKYAPAPPEAPEMEAPEAGDPAEEFEPAGGFGAGGEEVPAEGAPMDEETLRQLIEALGAAK